MLKEYDPVKLVALLKPARHFDGTEGVARAPRIGDTGTIVAISAQGDAETYVVESVDSDGHTLWLADFQREELDQADETIRNNYYVPAKPGITLYLFGAILGAVVAYLVATTWLGLSPLWVALLFGALAALIGVFMLENIGEAIVVTIILCVLMVMVITVVPGFAMLKSGFVPLACGLSVGKLVVGIWKEVFC